MKTKFSYLSKLLACVVILTVGCSCIKVNNQKQDNCSIGVEEEKSEFSMNWFLIGFNEEIQFIESSVRECFSKQNGVFKWMDYITENQLKKGDDIISYYFNKETPGQSDLKNFFTKAVKFCYDQLKLPFDKSIPTQILIDKAKFYKKYNTTSRSIGKLFAVLFKLKYIYESSLTSLI